MARVHVLLPAYNAEATLGPVLESVAAQSLRDFVCVVVDDGSTDRTPDIVRSFDDRFSLLRTGHAGIVSALNRGLAAMPDAELVARVDADDPCMPERFAAQVAALDASPDTDLVATAFEGYRTDGPLGSGMTRYIRWANAIQTAEEHHLARYIESPIAHSSVMARRKVFADGYRAVPWFEDYDLWLSRLNAGDRFAKLNQVLVRVLDADHRTSRTDPRCTQDALMQCKLHHLRRDVLATRSRIVLWGAGRVGKRWLRALPHVGVEVPHVVELHPRRIGKVIHGARVIAPADLTAGMSELEDPFLLAAVGAQGARADIRGRLGDLGYTEGVEYLFVA